MEVARQVIAPPAAARNGQAAGLVVANLTAFDPNIEDTLVFTTTGDDAAALRVERDPNDTDPADGIDLDLIIGPEFVTATEAAGTDGIFNISIVATDDTGEESDPVDLSFTLQILSA